MMVIEEVRVKSQCDQLIRVLRDDPTVDVAGILTPRYLPDINGSWSHEVQVYIAPVGDNPDPESKVFQRVRRALLPKFGPISRPPGNNKQGELEVFRYEQNVATLTTHQYMDLHMDHDILASVPKSRHGTEYNDRVRCCTIVHVFRDSRQATAAFLKAVQERDNPEPRIESPRYPGLFARIFARINALISNPLSE